MKGAAQVGHALEGAGHALEQTRRALLIYQDTNILVYLYTSILIGHALHSASRYVSDKVSYISSQDQAAALLFQQVRQTDGEKDRDGGGQPDRLRDRQTRGNRHDRQTVREEIYTYICDTEYVFFTGLEFFRTLHSEKYSE